MGKIKEIIKKHTTFETRRKLVKIAQNTIGKLFRLVAVSYEKLSNHKKVAPPTKVGWSIIVLTSGQSRESLDRFVLAAYNEFKGAANYEIIVVAPPTIDLSYFDKDIKIVHAPFRELHLWSVPFAIATKKNFAVRFAKYNKLAISHDYLYFLPGWKKGWDSFGEDFEVAQNAVLDMDGNRHLDWIVSGYPGIGQALLPYNVEFTEYMLMGGNYLVVKRDFFIKNPMNEKLRWGEAEDYEWAFRVRKITKFRCNPESVVKYAKFKTGIGAWIEGTKKMEELLGQKIL